MNQIPGSAIERIRELGGWGLWWLGMPRPRSVWQNAVNQDLHTAKWAHGGTYHSGDTFTRAALHAETIILEAWGLIRIEGLSEIPIYDTETLIGVSFEYTEQGAALALKAWEIWKRRHVEGDGEF